MALVILTMARSRSSMTAEIFRRHGVFFGAVRPRGSGIGYNEHPKLKELGQRFRPDCYLDIIRGADPELKIGNFENRWIEILGDDGWDGNTPWGAKVDVFCHRIFSRFDPVFVGLYRNPDDILASCMRAMPRRFTEMEWEKIIAAHHNRMDDLNIPIINTDKLVEGDTSELEVTLDRLDLGLSEQIVNDVIDGRS